jgi:hypothetical protein
MSDEDCQKQTRSSTPDQTNKMINVFRNVIPIAILTINGRRSGDRFLNDCWERRIIHYFKVCVPYKPSSRQCPATGNAQENEQQNYRVII